MRSVFAFTEPALVFKVSVTSVFTWFTAVVWKETELLDGVGSMDGPLESDTDGEFW